MIDQYEDQLFWVVVGLSWFFFQFHAQHNRKIGAKRIWLPECFIFLLAFTVHSVLMRNLMKVWKTWTGLSQEGRAWSRDPKSAFSEILQNKEHYPKFSKTEFQKWGFKTTLLFAFYRAYKTSESRKTKLSQDNMFRISKSYADLESLDHALSPYKGPVSVFHTFTWFLISPLWYELCGVG